MPELKVLHSGLDKSVNFVRPTERGYFESRYVRRKKQYAVVYLSSQSGCAQGCRMCHLTATRQTQFVNAELEDYRLQALDVLGHYSTQEPAEVVHYNFMARGEALCNPNLLDDGNAILAKLGDLALNRNLIPRFLISTIMPAGLRGKSLAHIFPLIAPEIYYSIYSTNEAFRKRWLPNALPVDVAMDMLAEYQAKKRTIVKLHWPFIAGQNDREADVLAICEKVWRRGLRVDINIVRYNPPDDTSRESSMEVIDRNVSAMQCVLPDARIDIVDRVGFDVAASCGMFVTKDAA